MPCFPGRNLPTLNREHVNDFPAVCLRLRLSGFALTGCLNLKQ